MSFFKKLFGTTTAAEEMSQAQALFDDKKFGHAKLGFEKAQIQARKEGNETLSQEAGAKVVVCLDAIALDRLNGAKKFLADNELELARDELRNGLEVVRDAALRAQLEETEHELEVRALGPVAQAATLSDDEIYAALSASWVQEQLDEYDSHGEPFRVALIGLQNGLVDQACEAFAKMITDAPSPIYLYYALGRAQLAADRTDEGIASMNAFFARIGPDEGGSSRLAAHAELAQAYAKRGDEEAATAELERAMDAFPEDHRPYMMLGRFLRERGHAAESVDVLEAATSFIAESRPDPLFFSELGMSYQAAGRDDDAVGTLEEVLKLTLARGEKQVLVEPTLTLAALREKRGDKGRAADLYRVLVQAGAPGREAIADKGAKLLEDLGLATEAEALRAASRAVPRRR